MDAQPKIGGFGCFKGVLKIPFFSSYAISEEGRRFSFPMVFLGFLKVFLRFSYGFPKVFLKFS